MANIERTKTKVMLLETEQSKEINSKGYTHGNLQMISLSENASKKDKCPF